MLRLSETNSTLKAREAEVASLQAQNALLRQQVEQQQQQLDAVGDTAQECEEGTAWWAGDEQY
jgi:chromosome segregation ATPase